MFTAIVAVFFILMFCMISSFYIEITNNKPSWFILPSIYAILLGILIIIGCALMRGDM